MPIALAAMVPGLPQAPAQAHALAQEIANLVRERRLNDPSIGLLEAQLAVEIARRMVQAEGGASPARTQTLIAITMAVLTGAVGLLFARWGAR